MPAPGQGNNGLGINSFSGPMGQKEPAYGAVERMKILSALAPVGSPSALGAPRRSKRAAMKGKKASAPNPTAVVTPASAPMPQEPPYDAQVAQFWQELAADPNASELVRRFASEVAG